MVAIADRYALVSAGFFDCVCPNIGLRAVNLYGVLTMFEKDTASIRQPSKRKEFLANFFLLCISTIFFFVVAEIAVRFFAPQYIKTFQYNPVVGITRIPQSHFTFIRVEDRARITHSVNSDGFIGPEYTIPKPTGTFRIVVLGDSYTEAIQVADWQRATAQLEKRLNALGPKKFEVINLGYSGFGTAQEYLTLEEFGWKYEPDLVLLNFYGDNDIIDNSIELDGSSSKPFFVVQDGALVEVKKPKPAVTNGILSFLTAHVAAPRFLYEKIQALKQRFVYQKLTAQMFADTVYSGEYNKPWDAAWEVTKKLIVEMNSRAGVHNAAFAIVSVPSRVQAIPEVGQEIINTAQLAHRPIDLNKPDDILVQWCNQQHIPLLTLRQDFLERQNVKDFYLTSDGHFSALGNDVFADTLFNYVVNQHLIPQ